MYLHRAHRTTGTVNTKNVITDAANTSANFHAMNAHQLNQSGQTIQALIFTLSIYVACDVRLPLLAGLAYQA